MTTKTTDSGTPLPMPKWTDTASVTSYITSGLAIVGAVVMLAHPGYKEPAVVQAIVPSVAAIIAGVSQIVNVITHRSAATQIVAAVLRGNK